MSRSWVAAASCAVLGCVFASDARAGQIVLDFNDLNQGQLSGQGGGTGLTGTWAGSTNPSVVAGDLTAPLTTHYAVPQSGTPQSVRTMVSSTNAAGQVARPAASTLDGTVWFSFLVNPNDANSRAGISFNTSGAAASGARIDVVASNLFVSYGTGPTLTNTQTVGSAHLIVGQVIVNEAGGTNDHLRLWMDPDVNTLSETTTTNLVFEGSNANWVADGITSVALQTYGNNSTGGTVDAVRVSNNPTAQADVTGVPEPTALAPLAIAAGFLRRRRRAS